MADDELSDFIQILHQAQWHVIVKEEPGLDLKPEILARHPNIPDEYLAFLRSVEQCVNPKETAWFLCETDYNAAGDDDATFRWNEWERMSLDAAVSEAAAIQQITHFWDNHFPIMSAVHSDYAYLAISLSQNDYGAIVYGYGPEFEASAEKVCSSFGEFLRIFGDIVKGEIPIHYRNEANEVLTKREFSDFL